MNSEIDGINKRLTDTLENNRHDIEAVFNLGIETERIG